MVAGRRRPSGLPFRVANSRSCSPARSRGAAETCRLAGFSDMAEQRDELREWDYGSYEGRTTLEIRKEIPGWTIWRGAVPEGEAIDEVAARRS